MPDAEETWFFTVDASKLKVEHATVIQELAAFDAADFDPADFITVDDPRAELTVQQIVHAHPQKVEHQ